MKKRDDVYIIQIQERIKLVKSHLKGLKAKQFFESDLHKAAVIRELEVIGEAARMVSEETKRNYNKIPWPQIIGMRNRLIHEYFSIDDSIVWEVAHSELPKIESEFQKIYLDKAPPAHPWRNCPLGYYFVHEHNRKVKPSEKNPDGIASVREHCRHNPSGKDQLYRDEIFLVTENGLKKSTLFNIGKMNNPPYANDFDKIICVWTQYWNEVLNPRIPLAPNIVKALFFSESSFNVNVKSVRLGRDNFARGPMQITDQTRKLLSDEKGELFNHFLTLTAKDVKEPTLAIAASIRWLFHKKEQASKFLKRDSNWEEAVANYKGYLKRNKTNFRVQKGMKVFFSTLEELEASEKRK